jgi:hypothetical protein
VWLVSAFDARPVTLSLFGALALAACSAPALERVDGLPPPSAATTELLPLTGWEVDPEWTELDAASYGPFEPCTVPLPRIEEGLVEFDTGTCDAYSVRAPLVAELAAGDWLEVVASTSILDAPTPAEGRLVVRLDGDELWRWERAIPSPADASSARFVARAPLAAGTWIGLHVSNHGANQWRLAALRRYRP